MWDWSSHEKLQSIDLGMEGAVPLEVRFLHEPSAAEGYVGCALGSTVYRFFRTKVSHRGALEARRTGRDPGERRGNAGGSSRTLRWGPCERWNPTEPRRTRQNRVDPSRSQ